MTGGYGFVRVVKKVLLANGHFAGVTPAIFVIFVDFRGPRSKIPCFGGQNAISEFSPIFVKTTCFRQGTKRPFSKTTVSTVTGLDTYQTCIQARFDTYQTPSLI